MDFRAVFREITGLPNDRTYYLDKSFALEALKLKLERSQLDWDEQAVIMAYYLRDGLPARQLSLARMHDQTGAPLTNLTAACDKLVRRGVLMQSNRIIGKPVFLLDLSVLEPLLSNPPP